ncbi:hypothetical protein [Pseudomonas aeruginosa]|uniref:hypothetical protein n=1 Tax=Pseudomonas aeruginosa TaxID=287 RepID=UPI0013A571D0|nr:hypothetical protein [Pseudomonas aeruginosa]
MAVIRERKLAAFERNIGHSARKAGGASAIDAAETRLAELIAEADAHLGKSRALAETSALLASSAMSAVQPDDAAAGKPRSGTVPCDLGQGDSVVAGRADQAMGPPDDLEYRLVLSDIEAGLTEEMRRLVLALAEFADRAKLIGESVPTDAHFTKLVTQLFALLGFQVANALGKSMDRSIFFDDGRQYLADLGLSLNEFIREVDLDGRRFLAVALIDK